jgi:2-phospho-L-lactate guanylyltransferase
VRVVLIAAKQLAFAKTRLAQAMPADAERIALAEAMFRDVLTATLSSRLTERVALITSDPGLIAIARAAGAIAIDEEFPRGLNMAVRLATAELIALGATVVCTVLSDIPLVTGDDIDTVFAALPSGGSGVVLVPSLDFSGTNMIARKPPDVIPTQFGRFSLIRHLEDCRARAVSGEIIRLQRPAVDLDLPADLIEFARIPSITHTYSHLARLGLLHG